jgi:dihydrofolate reductase
MSRRRALTAVNVADQSDPTQRRNLILQINVSLDGFFEGPNAELGWFAFDEAKQAYVEKRLNNAGGILLGGRAYRVLERYWPSATGRLAPQMNGSPEYVFSQTLQNPTWNNTTVFRGSPGAEVTQLKKRSGKDLVLLAGAEIARALKAADVIDEYCVFIYPVVLGSGKPLFVTGAEKRELRFVRAQTFGESGVVMLNYQPRRGLL